jgi:hypothetical protein
MSRAMRGAIRRIRRLIHTDIRRPLMWHRLFTSISGSSHDIGLMAIATDFSTVVVVMGTGVMGSAVRDSAPDNGLNTALRYWFGMAVTGTNCSSIESKITFQCWLTSFRLSGLSADAILLERTVWSLMAISRLG